MKKNLSISIRLTLVMIVLCAVLYPLFMAAIGRLTPGGGSGEVLLADGKVAGYKNIGQQFSSDRYFNGRPSAVDYNAAGSAGSNKGPSNPDYLQVVAASADTFLAHNPGIKREQIPADLVTASGSGLDPHISPKAAFIQVQRIAAIRSLDTAALQALVQKQIAQPLLGLMGPSSVNVLELNIALDKLEQQHATSTSK